MGGAVVMVGGLDVVELLVSTGSASQVSPVSLVLAASGAESTQMLYRQNKRSNDLAIIF